jgi:hypothetical protein
VRFDEVKRQVVVRIFHIPQKLACPSKDAESAESTWVVAQKLIPVDDCVCPRAILTYRIWHSVFAVWFRSIHAADNSSAIRFSAFVPKKAEEVVVFFKARYD